MTHTDTRIFVKSTWSGGNGGNCVEWAFTSPGVYVRDSKTRLGTELFFTLSEWEDLVTKAASGAAHDSISLLQHGTRLSGLGGELFFTHSEWVAFTAAARAGECDRVSYVAT
jgi:hypothetical protein